MLETLIVGLLIAILSALVLYAFRTRQLYLVIPQLFSSSWLSPKGKIVELRVFNKGRGAESDVQIGLDPAASYDIVASTDSTCSIEKSTVVVPRIPPGDDYSILVLVEDGELTTKHIAGISSSTTKGKVLTRLGDVPPNAGNVVLVVVFICLLLGTPIAAIEAYEKWSDRKMQERIEMLTESLGRQWKELERYAKSEFSTHYAAGEFPIHLIGKSRNGQRVTVKFKVINRAAAPLMATVNAESPHQAKDPEPWKSNYYESIEIPAASSANAEMILYWPKDKIGKTSFEFSMSVGEDMYITVLTNVNMDI